MSINIARITVAGLPPGVLDVVNGDKEVEAAASSVS
jgi:hypothetical protein